MKPILIRFWHGEPENSFFFNKVKKCCRKSELDGNFFFDGNLSQWDNLWRDKFLYIPANENDIQFIEGTIWITSRSTFGQR